MPEQSSDLEGRPVVEPDARSDLEPPKAEELEAPDGGGEGMSAPAPEAGGGGGAMSTFRENTATVMAVIVIIALGVLYAFMLRNVGLGESQWERAMIILSGVEAIVFGAAGFLFGTSIQRKVDISEIKATRNQADDARKQADEAKRNEKREKMRADREAAQAEAAKEKATEGKMLAAAVMAHTGGGGSATAAPEYGDLGGDEQKSGAQAAGMTSLQQLAQKVLR